VPPVIERISRDRHEEFGCEGRRSWDGYWNALMIPAA
jgi:hypothetical protein